MRTNVATIVLLIHASVVLVGCGVHVRYDKPYNDDKGLVKFRLVGSLLTLAAQKESQAGQAPKKEASADETEPPVDMRKPTTFRCLTPPITQCIEKVAPVVTPTYGSEVIAVHIHDLPWRRTTLSASYLDRQPELLKELGTEVTDYSVEIVGAVAAIAKTAIGFGILSVTPEAERKQTTPSERRIVVPSVIDVSTALAASEAATWTLLPNNDGWWYKLDKTSSPALLAVFPDKKPSVPTVETGRYFADFHEGGWHSATSFPASSCSGATLTLMFAPGLDAEAAKRLAASPPQDSTIVIGNLLIADPRFVTTYAIPEKGSIKFKGVCGADVDSKPSGVASGWKVLQTIADQAKAVFDAQKQDQKKAGTAGTK